MIYAFLFLSALGFLDASFLTYQHYSRDPFACPLFGGCEEVTSSIYSEVFGIPVALLGMFYYGLIFILSLYSYLTDNKNVLKIAAYFTPLGLVSSIYLVYIMAAVLRTFCLYCLISAATSTLLFFTFLLNWLTCKKTRSSSQNVNAKN